MDELNDYLDELKTKIVSLNIYAWGNIHHWDEIEDWINNFNNSDIDFTDKHRANLLHLLSHFLYFGSSEMRELLKSLYRDFFQRERIKEIRKENGDTKDLALVSTKYEEVLNLTRFYGIGNPSESGTHLLYYFRQENNISKKLFSHSGEIFDIKSYSDSTKTEVSLSDLSIKHYVFLDDFAGSGQQAVRYSNQKNLIKNIKTFNPEAVISYFALVATEDGLSKIKSKCDFDFVDAVCILDKSFKCFSKNARQFIVDNKYIDKELTKDLCESNGRLLSTKPLGFGDGQILLSFNHNTPNNTLPVFWSSGNENKPWKPIFKRYLKSYGSTWS
ncbi:hypothetical protein [Kangiella sp.]|uniref:phosphoribosyltransferase-like protein n=1 Tax=Kangiella sp. TaxID=1920245 RepID=UPI003A8DF7D0